NVTPMMKQYQEAKKACPDALLLFRMGDFYEMFHEDAKVGAKVLGLTLTSRDKGENATPMAGFPHHQLESYLGKLIASGLRAAVCDQVEDPREAKGLVRREVTRIVTPGTVTDEALLDPRESNYLGAVCDGEPAGLAWVEMSTGRFVAMGIASPGLADQLARIAPSECLLPEEMAAVPELAAERTMITRRPAWAFAQGAAETALARHFGTRSLEGFGFTDSPADKAAVRAAGAVLDYLSETQKSSLEHIDTLVPYRSGQILEIDEASRRSLEISRTIREGRRTGSLLAVLDRCVTVMGSRLLGDWIASPLTDRAEIEGRLDAVAELVKDSGLTEDLRQSLKHVYDVERLLTRVTTGRAVPRDLAFLGRTLACMPSLKARMSTCSSALLRQLEGRIELCHELRQRLEQSLVDECPLTCREGGFIREGFDAELDSLRELKRGGKEWIARYQAAEMKRTGIPSLKVGFNQVFGYYLEVTNAHGDKVPDDYIRKQTLKNAERYITPELKEYEEKVLTADDKAKALEYSLFLEIRDAVVAERRPMQATAAVLAQVDVLASLAELARGRNYCRPHVTEEPVLDIRDGRHPVLDITEPEGTFVPNDIRADEETGNILLITGPNMAGKSTYIRQVALLTLMTQIGSFIPASSAAVGIADRIFARVGASDELSRGQSTFMVEMTETARILNTATGRSLVILDEIGRGTSTYDGISLAWSVVEYLHDHLNCRTFFATHYHELTDLAQSLDRIGNLNVAVREWQDEVVFLHKIIPGAADKSYGIHVARLAGVPRAVIDRSKEILARLEEEHVDSTGRPKIARPAKKGRTGDIQLSLFGPVDHPLLAEVRQMDLNAVTPMAALQKIARWQAKLAENKPW
ncbi:MAG: DNA mismatch repair protein MutS, partial [Thermoguttaceae bacterium]